MGKSEKSLWVGKVGILVIVYGMFTRGKCTMLEKIQPKLLCPEGLGYSGKWAHQLVGTESLENLTNTGGLSLSASRWRVWGRGGHAGGLVVQQCEGLVG